MVELSDLEKDFIRQGKYTETMISETLSAPDKEGQGMNPTDKGYAKQFGDKIMFITENSDGQRTFVDIFENMGDLNNYDYAEFSDKIRTAFGTKSNLFFDTKGDSEVFGYMETKEQPKVKLDLNVGTINFWIKENQLTYNDNLKHDLSHVPNEKGYITIIKDTDNKIKFIHEILDKCKTQVELEVNELSITEKHMFTFTWNIENNEIAIHIDANKKEAKENIKYI